MLCRLVIEGLDKKYRSKIGSEVQGGMEGVFIILAVLSLDDMLHSSLFVTTCSFFQYILLYVVHWRTANLTIRRLAPPYFSSKIICNHMVRINFLKTAFQTS